MEGIGPIRARTLLSHFGSAKAVFSSNISSLQRVVSLGGKTIKALRQQPDRVFIEKELAFIKQHAIQALAIDDVDYPERLKHCPDAPLLLFYRGNVSLNASKVVAVIGTRNSTASGQQLTDALIATLSNPDILVVSGLAYGIDAHAHHASLRNGVPTVGVLAHGLDRIYPVGHKKLAGQMLSQGGLLTEYVSGTIPDKQNFPMRNRIVAGMADVTVVVETGIKGGAMITANLALDYNREVATFPGRPTDKQSAGCNELIKTNKAQLITTGEDLLELMNWTTDKTPKVKQRKLFIQLTDDQKLVTDVLDRQEGVHLDELHACLSLNSSVLAAVLLSLELDGLVQSLPGKRYRLA